MISNILVPATGVSAASVASFTGEYGMCVGDKSSVLVANWRSVPTRVKQLASVLVLVATGFSLLCVLTGDSSGEYRMYMGGDSSLW